MPDSVSRTLKLLRQWLLNDRVLFVVVNVAVNALLLVRSYVTMRTLVYSELGLVALLQTIMLLVAALQLGVLNGGYRLVCSESADGANAVNNFVYTFIGALSALLVVVGVCVALVSKDFSYSFVIALALSAGVLTIVKNWMTNFLIAKVKLSSLNKINFISALASTLPLAFVRVNPLLVCASSIVVQPLIFVAYGWITHKALRPTGIGWSARIFKQIMAAGFIVFLTSMFLVANSQIERWTIVAYLGMDGLGRFYLALLFLNLYALVPASLDAIFLPRLVRSYVESDGASVRNDMRRFLHALIIYSLVAVGCVFGAAPALLGALLPKYLGDLRYVYLVMPGVVVLALTGPFAIVLNVLIQYRYYFYAYGLGTLATAGLLGAYIYTMGSIDLTALSIIRSVVSALMGAVIVAGFFASSRADTIFRFAPFRIKNPAPRHASVDRR